MNNYPLHTSGWPTDVTNDQAKETLKKFLAAPAEIQIGQIDVKQKQAIVPAQVSADKKQLLELLANSGMNNIKHNGKTIHINIMNNYIGGQQATSEEIHEMLAGSAADGAPTHDATAHAAPAHADASHADHSAADHRAEPKPEVPGEQLDLDVVQLEETDPQGFRTFHVHLRENAKAKKRPLVIFCERGYKLDVCCKENDPAKQLNTERAELELKSGTVRVRLSKAPANKEESTLAFVLGNPSANPIGEADYVTKIQRPF